MKIKFPKSAIISKKNQRKIKGGTADIIIVDTEVGRQDENQNDSNGNP